MSFEFRCSYLVKDVDIENFVKDKKIKTLQQIKDYEDIERKIIWYVCNNNNQIWDQENNFVSNSIQENGFSKLEEKLLDAIANVYETSKTDLIFEYNKNVLKKMQK
ncbi:hypothetical protein [Klebsiella variicola]|uniref:hypothetical protein n=1 Tax=Klebsiella variicola TaxID=244366 RepID=UPI001BD5FAA5|nr:hypothetical protein [Klebsiella variicola]